MSSEPIKFPTGKIADRVALVIQIASALAVCTVATISIRSKEYSNAWVLLCAVLAMDSVSNFFEFLDKKEVVKTSMSDSKLALTVLWMFGTVIIWLLSKQLVPYMICSDYRIMGMVMLALITLSLINAVAKFNANPEVEKEEASE